MITLPIQGQWTQNNKSDIGGSIVASKNIDLTIPGYVKMADRVVSIKTEEGDSNFDMVKNLEMYSANAFFISTSDQPYIMSVSSSTGISVTEDTVTDNPSGSIFGDAIFWNNRWYVVGSTSFFWKNPSGGAWTSVSLSPTLTGSVHHPMCVFENRQTLVIGNSSGIKQINSSHADTTNLILPSEYEVIKIAYNNNRVGFLTRLTNNNAVKDSLFFVWDGSSAEADGGYAIGSPQGVAVIPYKSSFVVVNGKGQLLYFNGSGFDELDQLPIDLYDPTEPDSLNNLLTVSNMNILVDGDTILFNQGSSSATIVKNGYRSQRRKEYDNGSVWAWSPSTGLYHRHCASSAVAFGRNVTTSNVNTTTDVITVSATVPPTGTPVIYQTASTIIGGLNSKKTYYTINLTSTTLKLATTKTNALAGTAIDLTGTGNNAQFLMFYPEYDFGQMFADGRSGVLRKFRISATTYGNLEGNVYFSNESLYGTTISNANAHLCATVPKLENRSWIVTSKQYTEDVLDSWQKIYINYKPLVYDFDKIVCKYRTSDFSSLQQPATVDNSQKSCTWSSTTVFTTTDDFSNVVAGYEVEIVAGSGAGQTAHISSILESGGTYTVTLDEAITGVTAADSSYVAVSNWLKFGTVTTSTTTNSSGYAELKLPNLSSPWIQFKIEMRGIEVTINRIPIINKTHKALV